MTKGIAGAFALPGLFAFSLMSGRLPSLTRDFRVWLLTLVVLALCVGYYISRELYDPGYLQAVWQMELGSRFLETIERHTEGPRFYFDILIWKFEPGVVLLPFAALTVFGADSQRRSLAALCLSCAVAILLVVTMAHTKLYWYLTPILPFSSIAAALGVSAR
jgi:4-amino-4-deoxy-L-arabinose transferase-like glycosyltransferase